MKRLIPYLAVTSLAFTTALFAADTYEDPSEVKLKGVYNNISSAKFTHPKSERHHHLRYSEGEVMGIYKHRLKNQRTLNLGVGYMGTQFHFSHHPKKSSFKQEHFDNALFRVGASTTEIHRWKWKADLEMQMNAQHFSLSRYTLFTGILRGRYKYHDKRHLHVGVYAISGMRYTRVLPILGIDYTISEKWQLDAVFPTKMALVYSITPQWKVDAAIRYFLSRQRLGEHEHFHRGLVAYRNWGAEFGLNYAFSERIRFNAHIGESFDGRMRISHRNGHHRHHLVLDPAMYFGFTATLIF